MIKMGINSIKETTGETNYQDPIPSPGQSYQSGTDSSTATSRVVTDSESIARDIKDGRLSGFVGHGTALTGDTSFQMMLRVDGHLTGTVTSDGGTLIVGTNGQVDANVSVAVATVNGTINGDVTATEKVQLGRTARVIGNIATPKLVIEDGALFEGGCSMLKVREAQEKQQTASTSQYQSSFSGYSAIETNDDDDDEVLSTVDDDDDDDDEKADAATTL